jgi:hypothetical protein
MLGLGNWDCLDGFAEKMTSHSGPHCEKLIQARKEMDAVAVTKIIHEAVFGVDEACIMKLREQRIANHHRCRR